MLCPVCRARNESGPHCRRCRADLSLLFDLEQKRRRVLVLAYAAARGGDWANASRLAEECVRLRWDDDVHRLWAVCSLMRRDFAAAWQTYRSVHGK